VYTVDLDTRIVWTSRTLALSVSSWSSCRKEWTERYSYDASVSTLLFSRTTDASQLIEIDRPGLLSPRNDLQGGAKQQF
jgi:hypothetical protein